MKFEKISEMLFAANTEYSIAMNELYRPAEDSVQMAVCLSVKDVMATYLRAFLLFNDVNVKPGSSISQMLKQCKAIDSDFRNIDFSPVLCRAENGEIKEMYCISPGRIKKCFDAAHTLRELVVKKILSEDESSSGN